MPKPPFLNNEEEKSSNLGMRLNELLKGPAEAINRMASGVGSFTSKMEPAKLQPVGIVEQFQPEPPKKFSPTQFPIVEQEPKAEMERYQEIFITAKTPEEFDQAASEAATRASLEKNPEIKQRLEAISKSLEKYATRLRTLKQPEVDMAVDTSPASVPKVEMVSPPAETSTNSRLQELMAKYREAQQRANQGQVLESLMTSGESVAKAIAGAGYIPTAATVVPQAGISNLYGQDVRALDKEMAVTPMAESMENYDAASDVSQMARESLKNMLNNAGITIPKAVDKMSAAQISKIFPMFEPQIRAQLESAKRQTDQEAKKQEKLQKIMLGLSETVFKRSTDKDVVKAAEDISVLDETVRKLKAFRDNPKAINSAQQVQEIYGMIKALDPTSVVREGELAFLMKGQSLGEWVETNLSKVFGDSPKLVGSTMFRNMITEMIKASERMKKKFKAAHADPLNNAIKNQLEITGLYTPETHQMLRDQGMPYWDFDKGAPKQSGPLSQITTQKLKKSLEIAEQDLAKNPGDKNILNTIKEISNELNQRND